MEKQASHQLELFLQSQDNPELSIKHSEKNSFAARIWGYEKTILIIIALLITGIISFSLGVEKGKRMSVNPVRNTTQTSLNTIASNGVNQPALANLKGKSPVGHPAIGGAIAKPTNQKAVVWPPIAKPTNQKAVVWPPIAKPIKKVEPPKQPPVVLTQQGPYTIQVASFKTNLYAQKEAELLKQRGFKALTLKRGKYIILCVGNFPNKETARPLLSELSKYYKSCYIRRL
ncbi:MAG: hypothetical protein COT38_04380 [Candidatus Omnitrophica bacterium CG08_land_8_20_14_0_20_41_16]|uniref:SPOR domain-containing protein n=1 Tax=Candidatus Sherwoodlollariibacterium unditelluris TaxID=1974757 RepID=A0A2G9YM93_9BACT|nr:MAG: hypothetical protein COX41_00755 [Candidatus Omnitrophica bacterium CG23_combo_of_CG06-09_8_20_14_all_41_10]PIS33613.1 MAG: hypothetical protein COT38_04380 [Candidatus Omnitrophica bacterium CG08_land_8_20_14_0_20_41_16]